MISVVLEKIYVTIEHGKVCIVKISSKKYTPLIRQYAFLTGPRHRREKYDKSLEKHNINIFANVCSSDLGNFCC